jgi:hypothetical protein
MDIFKREEEIGAALRHGGLNIMTMTTLAKDAHWY